MKAKITGIDTSQFNKGDTVYQLIFGDAELIKKRKQEEAWASFRDDIKAVLEKHGGSVKPYDMGRIIHIVADDFTVDGDLDDWYDFLNGVRGD